MWRGQLAKFPVRPLWDLRPAAGAHGWMARWLDELPWARGSHWPWRRWRGRDERGWLVVPPPSPRFRRLPQAPVCEPHTQMEGRKKSASPHLPRSSLGIQVLRAMGSGRAQRVGRGKVWPEGWRSGMEGQSTWQSSRLRGAGLVGHGAWEPE